MFIKLFQIKPLQQILKLRIIAIRYSVSMKKYFLILLSLAVFCTANAQQTLIDSSSVQVQPKEVIAVDSLALKHSPRKATIYSALLPGLGQVYNKKYWKIPVLYGAFALTGYFINYNNVRYHKYNKELIARDQKDTLSLNPSLVNLDDASVKSASADFRRYRDLDIVIGVLIYVLNIVDAHVDAHLFYFNVDDNLSLRITPQLQQLQNQAVVPNLSLKFNF